MRGARASNILLVVGAFFALGSLLILSRGGQLLFWGIGAACLLPGLYMRSYESRRNPDRQGDALGSRTMKIILLCGLAAFVALQLWLPYSPAARQARRMGQAREHIPRVAPLIQADHRFALVEVMPYTAQNGSLGVLGYVRTEKDRNDLERLIQSTAPPVDVDFVVGVAGEQYDAMLRLADKVPPTGPASMP